MKTWLSMEQVLGMLIAGDSLKPISVSFDDDEIGTRFIYLLVAAHYFVNNR